MDIAEKGRDTQLIIAKGNPWVPVINLRTALIGYGEPYVQKQMKTMVAILYGLTYTGIILEVTEILPGIPDRLTVGVIIAGLVAANLIQWKQAIRDRDDFRNRVIEQTKIHREETKEQNANIMKMVEDNTKNITALFRELKNK